MDVDLMMSKNQDDLDYREGGEMSLEVNDSNILTNIERREKDDFSSSSSSSSSSVSISSSSSSSFSPSSSSFLSTSRSISVTPPPPSSSSPSSSSSSSASSSSVLSLISWNVAGFLTTYTQIKRHYKSLQNYFDRLGADIICIQESKVARDRLRTNPNLYGAFLRDWDSFWSCYEVSRFRGSTLTGYSGTTTFTRRGLTWKADSDSFDIFLRLSSDLPPLLHCSPIPFHKKRTKKNVQIHSDDDDDDYYCFCNCISNEKQNCLDKNKFFPSSLIPGKTTFWSQYCNARVQWWEEEEEEEEKEEEENLFSTASVFNDDVSTYMLNSSFLPHPIHQYSEGRILITYHSSFIIFNVYAPTTGIGFARLPFKMHFLHALRARMLYARVTTGLPVILAADLNIVYRPEDVYWRRRLVNVNKLWRRREKKINQIERDRKEEENESESSSSGSGNYGKMNRGEEKCDDDEKLNNYRKRWDLMDVDEKDNNSSTSTTSRRFSTNKNDDYYKQEESKNFSSSQYCSSSSSITDVSDFSSSRASPKTSTPPHRPRPRPVTTSTDSTDSSSFHPPLHELTKDLSFDEEKLKTITGKAFFEKLQIYGPKIEKLLRDPQTLEIISVSGKRKGGGVGGGGDNKSGGGGGGDGGGGKGKGVTRKKESYRARLKTPTRIQTIGNAFESEEDARIQLSLREFCVGEDETEIGSLQSFSFHVDSKVCSSASHPVSSPHNSSSSSSPTNLASAAAVSSYFESTPIASSTSFQSFPSSDPRQTKRDRDKFFSFFCTYTYEHDTSNKQWIAWEDGNISVLHLADCFKALQAPLTSWEMECLASLGTSYHSRCSVRWLQSLMEEDGMIDVFVDLHPNAKDRFTAWNQYTNGRYTNEVAEAFE